LEPSAVDFDPPMIFNTAILANGSKWLESDAIILIIIIIIIIPPDNVYGAAYIVQ